jgi:hypothetical protein
MNTNSEQAQAMMKNNKNENNIQNNDNKKTQM